MPGFTEFKQRAAVVWSAGAFEELAESIADVHSSLADALAPRPGEKWLDVACGAGHVAELAASAGAEVTGIDIAPRLIEVAKARAAAAGLDIDYRVGDAENLSVPDASFDVVSSSFGVIFAPDHAAAARELARVTRPGGRLGFSAWAADGSMKDMFQFFAQYQPPPPEGAGGPTQWGDEAYIRERLGDDFELSVERRISRAESDSLDEFWEHFSKNFGPVKLMLENLPPEKAEEFTKAALEHYGRHVQPDGRIADDRAYLLVTGIRKSA